MSSRNTSWNNLQQSGEGSWTYDEVGFSYDTELDPLTALSVVYNGLGEITVWDNLDLI